MKRIVCLGLALCLLVGLAACGKKDEDKKGETSSSSPVMSSAAVHTPSPAPVQMAKAAKVDADGGLNIRSEPSTDSEILGLAEDGSMLPLLVETPADGWYKIEYEGKTAYISAEYATVAEITLEEYNKLLGGASVNSSSSAASAASQGKEDPGKTTVSSQAPASSQTSGKIGNEDGE